MSRIYPMGKVGLSARAPEVLLVETTGDGWAVQVLARERIGGRAFEKQPGWLEHRSDLAEHLSGVAGESPALQQVNGDL